ncbi:TPA: glycosyltransferase WbuB [Vibrio vulnificus]|uniref:glycosyltransferase family 4 protein n=1 Tax=Vibrio vulnificus TaxID=672 RepID=UPI00054266E9|nr:glycosyltransferase family 4 protein [Vibrio vulnificus]EGQ7940829.1 glycosyltransferase family 4 protein [Vibrio vulnificus]EHU4848410.1 glycosyltransferase family 4 protein [Vibrio vulnificus]EIA1286372.1 glycosyltransferase family 4 protein [Vibrio vulnificus]EIA1305883.1 glycosyltransferase family 4 protein [Vibrio vulnificus]EID4340894.1 glycosyltransferase family 4 protein [Vibrio vulnificus]
MHLALIIDDYLPHSTRVGAKMFHELACHYVSLGHDVTVITPAEGQIDKLVKRKIDNVNVWSFSSGAIKDVPKITRAINETLLSLRAWRAISAEVKPGTFDGIIYYSPSIFFGWLVSKIKTRCQCKAYLVLRDLFPQWVIDAGMIRSGSVIEKYFRFFEKYSYGQADMIGLMSEKNLQFFNSVTQSQYSVEILRNWAELKPHFLPSNDESIRKRLNLEDKVIFFYGGNIGHAQDMANLMRLARAMSGYDRAHFLFVGQGDEVELINQLAQKWQLDNFTYLPSVNQAEFKNILADIDIGLFSLSAQHTAHNFPGKLLGYMVQSLPILGSVNQGNDLQEIMNSSQAGMISVNGEDQLLFDNALALYEDDELRKQIGKNAFLLLENEFSVQSAGSLILEEIKG